jgi:O-methyltransferase
VNQVGQASGVRDAYIELLAKSLTQTANGELQLFAPVPAEGRSASALLQRALLRRGATRLMHPFVYDPTSDPEGRRSAYELPPGIMTMIGRQRLDNVRDCIVDVIERQVPGDLIETGVWRGGTTIFMRGILEAYGDVDRRVFVADSFQGLPPPDADAYPADEGLDFHLHPILAVDAAAVRENFERYGLLDDRVILLEGWFADTLPRLTDEHFAVVRLDGDLYESTMDAIVHLYPRLSVGGWLIVDDYNDIDACKAAITDYRADHGITDEIIEIDFSGVCWKKTD